MRSVTPKVLHRIGGRSLVDHAVTAARGLEPQHLVVVVRHERDAVIAHLAAAAPDAATLRRPARAAVASGARVERAFEILGDDVPAHLLQAGRLRIAHKQASLEELGQLSDPQLTKDAVAGRIRRLLAMADKQAHELGIPDTESVLTQEMLEP